MRKGSAALVGEPNGAVNKYVASIKYLIDTTGDFVQNNGTNPVNK